MKLILVAAATLVAALAVGQSAVAAESKAGGGHHYYWVETPLLPPAQDCDSRDISRVINEGDICPALDAPTAPPLIGQ
jgi:hypothetical protein